MHVIQDDHDTGDDRCQPGEGAGIAVPLVLLIIVVAVAAATVMIAALAAGLQFVQLMGAS